MLQPMISLPIFAGFKHENRSGGGGGGVAKFIIKAKEYNEIG